MLPPRLRGGLGWGASLPARRQRGNPCRIIAHSDLAISNPRGPVASPAKRTPGVWVPGHTHRPSGRCSDPATRRSLTPGEITKRVGASTLLIAAVRRIQRGSGGSVPSSSRSGARLGAVGFPWSGADRRTDGSRSGAASAGDLGLASAKTSTVTSINWVLRAASPSSSRLLTYSTHPGCRCIATDIMCRNMLTSRKFWSMIALLMGDQIARRSRRFATES